MRLVTLSDIHIIEEGDAGHRTLEAFLQHPLVLSASHVGLLGDIFDLMAGDHEAYLVRYPKVFAALREICRSGKILYIAEGNHDMHLKGLYRRLTKSWGLEAGHRLQVIEHELEIRMGDWHVILGHGDEYNREDKTYLSYKRFIKKAPLAFVADHMMPLAVLDFIGQRASKRSRRYGSLRHNEDEIRRKFRAGVEALTHEGVDFVLGGHSHVLEDYSFGKCRYLNNGYPPVTKMFIVLDQQGGRLEKL